jgi:hypothetical protein
MKTRYFWSTVAASPTPKTVPVALLANRRAGPRAWFRPCSALTTGIRRALVVAREVRAGDIAADRLSFALAHGERGLAVIVDDGSALNPAVAIRLADRDHTPIHGVSALDGRLRQIGLFVADRVENA